MAEISFKGRHFQQDIILQSVRWYLAYSLSYRDIEELMQERGFSVDHSTINRWVIHDSPQLEPAFRGNPSILPQHPGYQMHDDKDPVTGQSRANDAGRLHFPISNQSRKVMGS